jgi:hypothetical protein
MAKPIFIVRIPTDSVSRQYAEHFDRMARDLQSKMPDYHVLVMMDNHVKEAQFQCFNSDMVPEIELDALKEMCMNALKDIK